MATFDLEQQKIVARIVYDGVAHAGKTTNVRHLGDLFTGVRRSEMVVPEEQNGRTLWFDWVQLEGGMICGFPLSCQIVTVPGQRSLAHRRRHLLRTADAVVYVADSSRRRARRTREGVELLRGILDERGAHRPPLVLQANKQDQPDAMSLGELVEALGLPPSIAVVPARAHEGVGVRETLIRVVRTLTDHVQQLAAGMGCHLPVRAPEAAGDLHAAMVEQDDLAEGPDAGVLAELAELDDVPDDAPNSAPAPILSVPEMLAATTEPAAIPASTPARAARARPPLPRADARTGYVWPAMTARDVLRELESAESHTPPEPMDDALGADQEALLWRVGGFVARSSRRRYVDSEEARAELIRLARGKSLIGDLQLPGTVLALQRDEDGTWRLWTVHRRVSTLDDDLESCARGGDEVGGARVLAHFARLLVDAIVLASREHLAVSLALSDYALVHDRTYYVGDEVGFGSRLPALGESVFAPLEHAALLPEARALYLERLEDAMRLRLTAVDVERAEVVPSLLAAAGAAAGLRGVVERLARAVQPRATGRRQAVMG